MLHEYKTVKQWAITPSEHEVGESMLQYAFDYGTKYIDYTGSPAVTRKLFEDIWLAVCKRDTVTHAIIPGEYEYVNVGVKAIDITTIYRTLYESLRLCQKWETNYEGDALQLGIKIRAILTQNLSKYLTWIETMGLCYNPLWNVDGTEDYQSIDEHGNITNTRTPILTTDVNLQTAPYDSAEYRNTQKTINTYNGTQETNTESHTAIAFDSGDSRTLSGAIKNMTAADYSHIEKRVRQGNIGIVSTVKLIEEQRDLVKFNLIQEFFNDINKQILIGIYK